VREGSPQPFGERHSLSCRCRCRCRVYLFLFFIDPSRTRPTWGFWGSTSDLKSKGLPSALLFRRQPLFLMGSGVGVGLGKPASRPRLADSRSKTQNRRPRCFKFMTSVRLPIVSEADRRLYWLPLAQTGLMGSMGLIFRNKSPSLLAGAEHLGGHGPGPGPWPSWRSKPSSGWAITAVPHSRVLEWMISATFALKGSLLMLKASDEWIPSFSRHSLRKIRGTVACS